MNKSKIKQNKKIEEIRRILEKCGELVDFKYDGRWGNMESYYYPEEEKSRYLLYFEGYDVLVESLDEALDAPFIDGKSLKDVVKDIIIYNGQERIYKY